MTLIEEEVVQHGGMTAIQNELKIMRSFIEMSKHSKVKGQNIYLGAGVARQSGQMSDR